MKSEFNQWKHELEVRMERALGVLTVQSIEHTNTIAMQEQTIGMILSSIEALT